MTWQDANPADIVAAPVRAALNGLVVRSTIAFALAVAAVLPPGLPIADRGLRIVAYHGLPALLAVYLILHFVRVARSRKDGDPGTWSRAKELAPSDVLMARAMTVIVPCAILVAGVVLLWPHMLEPDDRTRVVSFFVPLFGLLWTATAIAWFDECRDRLTAACSDSEKRYRAYWAGIASR